MSRDGLLGALAVAAAACTWGTLGFFAKVLYSQGVSFEALVAVRAGVGWLAVMLFLTASGGLGRMAVARRDLASLVPLGLLGIGVFYLLYFFTVRESTVGTAAILLYSSPAFVVGLAWLFLDEGLGRNKALALLLTLCGIALVAGAYDPSDLQVGPLVLATGLLSGLAYGLYSIFGKPVAGRLSPAVVLGYALFFGSLVLVPFAIPTLDTLVGLPPGSYVLLLVLGALHTAGAFALYTYGLAKLGAGGAAIVATVEPVVAGATGVVLLGEGLTAAKLAGAALVVGGAALAQAGPKKRVG